MDCCYKSSCLRATNALLNLKSTHKRRYSFRQNRSFYEESGMLCSSGNHLWTSCLHFYGCYVGSIRDTRFASALMQMTPRCTCKQAASLALAACTLTAGMETLTCTTLGLSGISGQRPHNIKNNISFQSASTLTFHNDRLI